jgi:DNA-binding transcriptional LysR family regulator
MGNSSRIRSTTTHPAHRFHADEKAGRVRPPLANKKKIPLERIAREPWLMREKGSGTRNAIERIRRLIAPFFEAIRPDQSSRTTVYRELAEMVEKGCLVPTAKGGRNSGYLVAWPIGQQR